MELTNAQAREKWCPFVRVSTGSTIITSSRTVNSKCLGNGCMAWIETRSKSMGHCGLVKEVV